MLRRRSPKLGTDWEQVWENKLGTEHQGTPWKTVEQPEAKSKRGKDGRLFRWAHNPPSKSPPDVLRPWQRPEIGREVSSHGIGDAVTDLNSRQQESGRTGRSLDGRAYITKRSAWLKCEIAAPKCYVVQTLPKHAQSCPKGIFSV